MNIPYFNYDFEDDDVNSLDVNTVWITQDMDGWIIEWSEKPSPIPLVGAGWLNVDGDSGSVGVGEQNPEWRNAIIHVDDLKKLVK